VTKDRKPISYKADIAAANAALSQIITAIDGPFPPSFVIEFLKNEWRRYLVRVHHYGGEKSEQWQEALAATRQLLESVLPVTTAEQRHALTKSIPSLLAAIKKGAQLGVIDPMMLDPFLRKLGDVHLGKSPSDSTVPPQVDLSDTVSMDVRDPRLRALLDQLDGADGVEHIDM
jgi:Protein of unknown function (DUF1631)